MAQEQKKKKKGSAEHQQELFSQQHHQAYTFGLLSVKIHNHNSIMSIQSLADHSVKWAQIRGGDGHLWVTGLRLCEFRDCVCVCACAHQCPVSAPCAGSSSGLTMLSVCLRVITPFWHLPPTLLPSPFSCPFLSPSLRFSLAPHLSHCQALVHSTSPLAPWPGLPSNNFISFPPLSRRPAPPLTIGCCFFFFFSSEKRRKKKKSTGLHGAGWEPNKSWQCARHRTVILMAAVGMYGPEVTHKRPACICSCRAGKQGTHTIKSRHS